MAPSGSIKERMRRLLAEGRLAGAARVARSLAEEREAIGQYVRAVAIWRKALLKKSSRI